MEFDENKAIELMRAALPEERRNAYDDDEILNVIDMIWDFYEENGMLDIDFEDEEEDAEAISDDLVNYVTRMLRKDKGAQILAEEVPALIDAEIAYEASLDE